MTQQIESSDGSRVGFDTAGWDVASNSNIPIGIMVHEGALSLDGSTGGNTADLRFSLKLPGDDVYMLTQFFAAIDGTTVEGYGRGILELYPQVEPAKQFGSSRQINIPLNTSVPAGDPGGASQIMYFDVGNRRSGEGSSGNFGLGVQDPGRLILFGEDIGGTAPLLWIGDTTTDVASGQTLRYWIQFLIFDFQTVFNMPLFYRSAVR